MAEICCQQAPLEHKPSKKCTSDKTCATTSKKSKSNHFRLLSPSSSSSSSTSSSSSSSTESIPGLDQNNNNNGSKKKSLIDAKSTHRLSAVRFKHHKNAPAGDLESVRQLLAEERDSQAGQLPNEEAEFYRADFERMLADDWLVTRFLLRGKKAHERLGKLKALQNQQQHGHQLDEQQIYAETLELIKVCAKFRFEYRINNKTRESEFPLDWVKVNGLFDYMPDRAGNPTVYLRVALHRPKLIETPEARHLFKRYMLYTLERCDQQLHNDQGKAICCIFDMTSVALENIDLELTTWMVKSFKSCSPKLLCYVVIYNPPWFFTTTFKLICNTLLSNSKRQSVKFAHGDEILQYVQHENLPHYLQSTIIGR